jgi:hypothetical protein
MKYIFVFCIFVFFCISTLLGQNEHRKSKYGVYIEESLENPMFKNQKKQLKYFIEHFNFETIYPIDRRNKVRYFHKDTNLIFSEGVFLKDTLEGTFEIVDIFKKKNNYLLVKDQLIKKTIFFIDIKNISVNECQNPSHLRIISVKNKKIKGTKIKKRMQLQMTLFSFFDRDCCNTYPIQTIRSPMHSSYSFFIEDIFVADYQISNYNHYETYNLNGLYYYNTPQKTSKF